MVRRADHILGVFLGLLLFLLWISFLFIIATSFLAEKETVNGTEIARISTFNQIFIWIMAGPLPFLLVLGHYLISGEQEDVKLMKFSSIGFSIWLTALLIAFLASMNMSPRTVLAGGYMMIFLILLFEKLKHAALKDNV
ncbi:hypothetical protein [Geoglobus acetivorans]|uniref:Uncharacterized protein n=1 Tax=Geoglobus acetivorans TaxID=565033 RepID=A0ABZ3H5F9_GEOAI|nr:hypothetical protein [Geoglobus acetivorans]